MSTAGEEYAIADASLRPVAAAPVRVAKAPPGQWPFMLVAGFTVMGLALFTLGATRPGLLGLAVAMGLAGLLRLVLPTATAGWLTSRSRLWDAAAFGILGAAMAAVALLLLN